MKREPATAEIEELERLLHTSRFLDAGAWLHVQSDPEGWTSTRARVAAGRALGNLGASARARRLNLASWRRDPTSTDARYFMTLDYCERHGPLETLRLLDQLAEGDPQLAHSTGKVDWPTASVWLLRARCLAQCRDFSAAEDWLQGALTAYPDEPWTHVEHARCLEQADLYVEALNAAEHALALRPGYSRAVWQLAHLLTLVGRDTEALHLLQRETDAGTQSAHLAMQRGSLLSEFEQLPDALGAFELARQQFARAEKSLSDYLRSRCATLLHRLGRDAEAVAAAEDLRGRFWEQFTSRLGTPSTGRRFQLPVPFVRQHHMTCAPATLAAVSTFLGTPLDAVVLAAAITYDGTPDHEERHWLESNGWTVREFRVTWPITKKLLDRELPFTLVTTWVGSSHLQAVVGYDDQLETLIIRDPYHRESHEVLAAELLEQQAPYGPRGMVFVPRDQEPRLHGIELPEASAFDEWFHLRRSLVHHDRRAAAAASDRLAAISPESRLSLWALRQLAYYDENPARALAVVARLREAYPADVNLQIEELSLLTRLGRRADHRERVSAILRAGRADPAIWREQVAVLRQDGREHQRALRLAKRFARSRPFDWTARAMLADVMWDGGYFERAGGLYRLAAAAGDKVEAAWRAYFAAARHTGTAPAALAMLERRRRQLADRSAEPTITLARALDQLDRLTEARDVLEAALACRPDDGELLLELAILQGRTGAHDRARALLELARTTVQPIAWHRTAARLAWWRGDHRDALDHNEGLLAANPLDTSALADAARLRAITTGPGATLSWLATLVTQHPHFLPLRQLRLEWLRERPAGEALSEVTEFLELEPNHAWALRERALILLRAGRLDDALASATLAEEIEPHVPPSAGIVGQVLLAQRAFAAARLATERALRLDIAADWLMPQLISACPDFAERAAAVAFLHGELERQPAPVTGFLRFREVAVGILSTDRLWEILESLRASDPERWEPWSASIEQAIAMGRTESARALAEEAVRKFPLIARAWLNLADVHRLAGSETEEKAALVRAREISPGWRDPAFRLASLCQRMLQPEESERVLASALAHDPLDAGLRLRLAEVVWRRGRREEALEQAQQAAEAAPGWSEPWSRLVEWGREIDCPHRVLDFARQVVSRRPGDPQPRRQVAHILTEQEDFAGALIEIDAALRLAPIDADLHDFRAFLLARLGRRDEALAVCGVGATADRPSFRLLGRAAWIRWQFGERQSAIEAMKAVMSAHPDYAWGWQQLAEWHGHIDENQPAAHAAEKFAELCPADPSAWAWVASLKIKAGDAISALPLLERAARLDPAHHHASFQLLRIAAEYARWPEAERALMLIRQHASRWHALRAEVLYHRFRKDQIGAITALKVLALVPAHETIELTDAVEDAAAAGWLVALTAPLGEVLCLADANPEAGAVWMRAHLAHASLVWLAPRRLERCSPTDRVRRNAWRVYLEWLAEHRRQITVRWHLWRRGPWLVASDDTWGTVTYVLATLNCHRMLVHWMRDWPTRAGKQPWMLSNLVHSLIALDRWAEVKNVVDAALQLPPDHTRGFFVACQAHLAVQARQFEDALRWIGIQENARNDPFTELLAEQARGVVELATASPAERRSKWRNVRDRMEATRLTYAAAATVPYMAREHRRALQRAADLARSPWRWWYALPRFPAIGRPITIAVAVLVVVGFGVVVSASSAPIATIVLGYFLARLIPDRSRR